MVKFIVFLVFLNTVVANNLTPPDATSTEVTTEPSSDPDQQCAEFLERTQQGLISKLETMIAENRVQESCLLSQAPSGDCSSFQNHILEQLPNYERFRILNSLNLATHHPGSDFELSADTGNAIRRDLSRLSETEQEQMWQEHQQHQRDYIQDWWPQNNQRFPNWRQCVVDGENGLNLQPMQYSGRTSVALFPNFDRDPPRQFRQECQQMYSYWRELPFAVGIGFHATDAVRPQLDELTEQYEPWMHMLTSDTSTMSRQEKLNQAARAHNQYGEQLNILLRWVQGLRGDTREKLLAFENIRAELNGETYCQDYSRFGWNDLADIGLMLIPGFNLVQNIFRESPVNDAAFLAGFANYEEYRQRRDEIAREIGHSALLVTPQGAAEAVAIGRLARVAEHASPLVRRLAGRVGDMFSRSAGPVRMSSLNLSEELGRGAEKIAYDLGDGQVALIHRSFDRAGNPVNAEGLTSEFYERVRRDYDDVMGMAESFDGLTFNGQALHPRIGREIVDDQGQMIGYVTERVDGEPFDRIASRLTAGERQEVVTQARAQLAMMYERGLIHGDAHAGNLMVSRAADGTIQARFVDFTAPNSMWNATNDYQLFTRSMSEHGVPRVNTVMPTRFSGNWAEVTTPYRGIAGLEVAPTRTINGATLPRTDGLGAHQTYDNIINGMLNRMDEGVELSAADIQILEEFTGVARAVAEASGDTARLTRLNSSDIGTRTEALIQEGQNIIRTADGRLILIGIPGN